jgi:transaldolase
LITKKFKVELFADGADISEMKEMNDKNYISGLTTNPTLMYKAGIKDYRKFGKQVLEFVTEKPISFEVFSDELYEMENQALELASWGPNVFVKIPITNTRGESTKKILKRLIERKVQINITAVMTLEQVQFIEDIFDSTLPTFVSVFAGRIADTGRNPEIVVSSILKTLDNFSETRVIWASPREFYNVIQADQIGCHIITATSEILNKISLFGKDLNEYSLETVQMFRRDAVASNFKL